MRFTDRLMAINWRIETLPPREEVMAKRQQAHDDAIRVRRLTIYMDRAGEYRFRAQAGNWQTIPSAEEGVKTERAAQKRALRTYPQTEELVDSHGKSYLYDELDELRDKLLG